MAATITKAPLAEGWSGAVVPGSYFEQLFTVTGDASYPAGGYPINVAAFQAAGINMNMISTIDVASSWVNGATATLGALAIYNSATGKVQAFGGTPASGTIPETAAATNMSTLSCTLRIRFR